MRHVLITLLMLSLAAPLAAQAPPPPPPAPSAAVTAPVSQTVGMTEDDKADLNRRIRRFQSVVQSAVENGASRLADRAEQMVKGAVDLVMNGRPQINPVFIPQVGYHYDVQVPDILGSSYALWLYTLKRQQQLAIPTGNKPGDDRVTASGVVKADPVVTDPSTFDPNVEYAIFVRQELIEAMVESSNLLPLKPEEWLVISARVPADVQATVLSHHRRIVMQVLGSDLIAFRQGQLTKDQVKERIQEFRY
jgi:hypothetical protein